MTDADLSALVAELRRLWGLYGGEAECCCLHSIPRLLDEIERVKTERDVAWGSVKRMGEERAAAVDRCAVAEAERDEARKELAEARARVEQLEAWKAACTIDFRVLTAERDALRRLCSLVAYGGDYVDGIGDDGAPVKVWELHFSRDELEPFKAAACGKETT